MDKKNQQSKSQFGTLTAKSGANKDCFNSRRNQSIPESNASAIKSLLEHKTVFNSSDINGEKISGSGGALGKQPDKKFRKANKNIGH